MRILCNLGLVQSRADPCLFLRFDDAKEVVFLLVIFVDDLVMIGKKREIERFKCDIQKHFAIVDLGPLKKHLSVWYKRKSDTGGEYFELQMKDFAQGLIRDYEELTGQKARPASTPGLPGTSLVKQEEGSQPVMRDEYRSLIGKAMWFLRKIEPECSNAGRELSAHMECPGEEHWKALSRLIGYIAADPGKTLKLRTHK
mgnify:CR=1 FL=1